MVGNCGVKAGSEIYCAVVGSWGVDALKTVEHRSRILIPTLVSDKTVQAPGEEGTTGPPGMGLSHPTPSAPSVGKSNAAAAF